MPNKNPNKKSKTSLFKKRFDLTNRKVQFFVVIAIFAILGGGYFTFRSFAATNYIIRQAGSTDTLAGTYGYHSISRADYCRISGAVVEKQKNNQLVESVICKPVPDSHYAKFRYVDDISSTCTSSLRCGLGKYLNSDAVNYAGRNVQMCSYLKASTPNTKFVFLIKDLGGKRFYEKATVTIPTDRYVSVCSDWVRVPINVTNGVQGVVYIQTKAIEAVGGFWGTLTLQSNSPLPTAPATPTLPTAPATPTK